MDWKAMTVEERLKHWRFVLVQGSVLLPPDVLPVGTTRCVYDTQPVDGKLPDGVTPPYHPRSVNHDLGVWVGTADQLAAEVAAGIRRTARILLENMYGAARDGDAAHHLGLPDGWTTVRGTPPALPPRRRTTPRQSAATRSAVLSAAQAYGNACWTTSLDVVKMMRDDLQTYIEDEEAEESEAGSPADRPHVLEK